ncbi:MAG: hypothetical protein IKX00_01810 [Bacilli bacterium]|nr:hypothetical protein [Bacilli bacterium]
MALKKYDIPIFATGLVFAGAAINAFYNINEYYNTVEKIELRKGGHRYNIVICYDGEVINGYDEQAKEINENVKYYVRYQDDKSLVIYVYTNDLPKNKYNGYIESKVFVNDNKIFFDEYSINSDDYDNYIVALENDLTSGTQRVRYNQKEN